MNEITWEHIESKEKDQDRTLEDIGKEVSALSFSWPLSPLL